jgi:hypothetical protein
MSQRLPAGRNFLCPHAFSWVSGGPLVHVWAIRDTATGSTAACPVVAVRLVAYESSHFTVKMLPLALGDRRMWVLALMLCLVLAACTSTSESIPQDVVSPPDPSTAFRGLKAAASEAHLAEPVEVSDPIRANIASSSPWLICLRSGKSEETKRLTYSAFFKKDYVSSRWSVVVDHCGEQVYHPLNHG